MEVSVSEVPPRIRALCEPLPDIYLGGILTLALHAFPRPDGTHRTASVWVLLTDRRALLASATDEGDTWLIGTGNRQAVDLVSGWTRDTLVLESWRLDVAKNQRGALWDLIKRWRESGVAAPAWPPPPPPRRMGRVARGALGLPAWWTARVPSEPDETWLFGMQTGSTQPFSGRKGTVEQHPVWLGVSDRGQALAAEGPEDDLFVQRLEGPVRRTARPGRDKLEAGPRTLVGALTTDADAIRVDALTRPETPAGRWAAMARLALSEGDVPRALDLYNDAASRGLTDEAWADVARLVWAMGQPSAAASLLAAGWREDLPLEEAVAAWQAGEASLAAAVHKAELFWAAVQATLSPWLRDLPEPKPPGGYPWPPADVREAWAGGAALASDWPRAQALWNQPHARAQQAHAALARAAGDADTADRLRQAAHAWRAEGQAEKARATLEEAIDRDATGADHWQQGAWAWEDQEAELAQQEWTEALTLDPAGVESVPLPAEGYRQLGAHAARSGAWSAAAMALTAFLELQPDDDGVRRTLVTWLEGPLGRPGDAAQLMVRTEARRADGELPEPEDRARWQRFVEIGRLFAMDGQQDAAIEALQEAVSGDFLIAAALEAALRVPGITLPPALAGWWQHLHDVLAGGDSGTPLPPLAQLDDESLDGLHPGGRGWLEDLRSGLDPTEPPDLTLLTRGLERLAQADAPLAHQALEAACQRLGMEPPDAFLYRGEGSWGASAWPTEPPVLLLGYAHLREQSPHHLDLAGLTFLLTVECTHLRCRHPLLAFDQTLVGTSTSVYTAFGKYAGTAETVVDLVTLLPGVDQLKKLQTLISLSRKVFTARSLVDKGTSLAKPVASWLGLEGATKEYAGIGRENLTGTFLQFRMQADRVGLLCTGDLRAAVDAVLAASTSGHTHRERVRTSGLQGLLKDPDSGLGPEETLRLTALMGFAAREMPR